MVTSTLFLDCGNTRIKYAYGDQTGALSSADECYGFVKENAVSQIVLTGVSEDVAEVTKITEPLNIPTQQVLVSNNIMGIKVAYSAVEQFGVDRWLAMVAAQKLSPTKGYVVADIGTALTIDVVSNSGEHLGGVIAPGALSNARALNDYTAKLPLADFSFDGGLGKSTMGCLNYGVIVSCVALIEHSMVKFGSDCELIITGGDAEHVLPHLKLPCIYEPNLVLDGLKFYWQQK